MAAKAFILIETSVGNARRVAEVMKGIPEIEAVDVVTGTVRCHRRRYRRGYGCRGGFGHGEDTQCWWRHPDDDVRGCRELGRLRDSLPPS